MKFLIAGAGAIGAYIGARMARAVRSRRDPAGIRLPPAAAVPRYDDIELPDSPGEPGLEYRSVSEDHDPLVEFVAH